MCPPMSLDELTERAEDVAADEVSVVSPAAEPWYLRRGPIARIRNWAQRPWTTERLVQSITATVILIGATFSVFEVVHFPGLVLRDNTPTGGDMGAHVFAPAYLRDVLLPHWQLSGWSNYWYAGFPLYRFYMVIPALMIVALDVILPYGVAFKVVTILGLVTLPLCCWAFGRLARFVFPIPELMALASLWFIYDESFYLLGGNVKSTMAGEFSFSIALSFAVLGLGLFARGLETGKHRSWTAILLALAMLSHGIVLLFTVGAALLMWLVWVDRRRLIYGATVLGSAFLLSAFWVVPFVLNHQYMTDMKYGGRPSGTDDSFWTMFFPWSPFLDILVSGFALVGFVVSIAKRHIIGAWLGITCVALFAATYLARESLPLVGLLWNPRILPFLYLMRLLLMMVGIVEVVRLVTAYIQVRREPTERAAWITGAATAGVMGIVVLISLLFAYRSMPGAKDIKVRGKSVYAWGAFGFYPIQLGSGADRAASDGWTRYNFLGYEGHDKYAEYKYVVDRMDALGKDPGHGCGRAIYENSGLINGYGTTMAFMLLPHWTKGCITSMEGVFFEASGTTPYHFLTAAAVSADSSNPVRGLYYRDLDMARGAKYMETLGVRYLMVVTQKAKEAAALEPALKKVASAGPWVIYEIPDTTLVQPLSTEPVVVNHRGGDQRERFLELGTSWFTNQDAWPAIPATDGPADWQRVDLVKDPEGRQPVGKDDVQPVKSDQEIEVRTLPEVTVSDVHLGNQDLSFHVDTVGVPVLVKMSYFPNWTAHGATGPYRAGANQMIVVPTSNDVRLAFERSTIDIVAYLLTGLGILALVWMRRQGDMDLRRQMVWASSAGTAPLDPHHVTAPALADVWSEPPPDDSEPPPDDSGPPPDDSQPPPDGVVFDDRPVESGAPGAFLDEPLPAAPHAGDTAGSETVAAEADDPDSLGPR